MHSGCVSGSKKGGVQLGLAFVLCANGLGALLYKMGKKYATQHKTQPHNTQQPT